MLETFNNVNLNPSSDRYIARIVGDQHIHYDFDKGEGRQKLVIDGLYPNRSRFVRVEISDDLDSGAIDATALPMGFRGLNHLVTSGSNEVTPFLTGTMPEDTATTAGIGTDEIRRVVQPPVPFRENLGMICRL